MIVLAIETATRDGSVALARDGNALASARGDGGLPHATRLPGDALALLGPAGLTVRDVDVFAVCLGPGAFTGLRVGIAAAQGLAFATALTSSNVSRLTLPAALRTPPLEAEPGTSITRFDPKLERRASIAFCAPLPIASIAITAPTPIKIPSIDKALRTLLAVMARSAE